MTGNKFNGITRFLKRKRSFCALLLAMIFLFTTSIAAYALQAEVPTANPPAETYGGTQNIELKTETVGASVYYTTDGSEPTTGSTLYTNPIAVASNMTIKAIAVKDGMENSSVSTFEYVLFAGGSGTETDPYQVATAEQLNNVRNYLDKHFIQTADIDLGVEPYNTGAGWEPIGNDLSPFTGTFDGKGNTISKLTINRSTTNYVGLFGFTGVEAEIKNVKLEETNVTGSFYTGGLVGWNCNGTITDSYAIGAVAGDYFVGGLVGVNNNGAITNSYATGAVAGDFAVGGLVGLNSNKQYGNETITDSYASGNVTGTKSVGGLVGDNYNGAITNSYATGNVEGTEGVGGLVGYNGGVITNAYAIGVVIGTSNVGGLVGNNNNGTVTASFWDTDTSGTDSSLGGDGAIGKNTTDMNLQGNYEGWNFDKVWGINDSDNNRYPFLRWQGYKHVQTHALNITASTSGSITTGTSGNYLAGTDIAIAAKPASGYSFNKWTSTGGGTFANANNASTTYTMPANPATITATFTYNSSGGGNSGGSSGSSSSTPTGILVTSSGKTASVNEVTVTFPGGAVENDIRVQIKETGLSKGMSLPDDGKLLSQIIDIIKDKSGSFKKTVTITLPFNKSVFNPDEHDIAIYYYDEDTGKWIALANIKLNLEAGTISGDTTHFTKFAVIATPKAIKEEKPVKPETPQPIKNIPGDISGHWAKDSILKLINAGVISGYPDGTFKPNNTVTRAEFTVMLVKTLNLETRVGKTFNDTNSHWAKDSISAAAAHGIISGYDENTFGPDDLITREQAALIIARAAQLETATDELNFTDSKAISSWAKPGVAAAFKGGFISGYPDNSFKPQGNTTRAEAAVIIGKLLK